MNEFCYAKLFDYGADATVYRQLSGELFVEAVWCGDQEYLRIEPAAFTLRAAPDLQTLGTWLRPEEPRRITGGLALRVSGTATALAVEAFAPDMASFKCGRDFAAWLGLVPRQHSSGGKERLGRISKAGQTDIRRLLIIGAMSRLNWLGRRSIPEGSWLARMLTTKPRMLVAIALANKMARAIWAMLTRKEDYRDPAQARFA